MSTAQPNEPNYMNNKAINPPYRPLSAPEFVLCAINMCDARKENDAVAYECALEQLLQYLNIFAKHGWIT